MDYYALTPQPRDFVSWQTWQFHSTREDAGFVQAFRLESPQSDLLTTGLEGRGFSPAVTRPS